MIERRIVSPQVVLVGLALFSLYYLIRDLPGGQMMVLGYLTGVILLALILVGYEKWCFPLLMMTFFWAGLNVPLNERGQVFRWAVLGLATSVGIIVWLFKGKRLKFGAFHIFTAITVLVFLSSTMGSVNPSMTFLKVSTLALLFSYASIGVRLSYRNKEGVFLKGLKLCCEATVYISAFFYNVLHHPLYGNPNSLGAVMGVVVCPILVWSVVTERTGARIARTGLALALCGVLLYQSFARASFVSAVVSGSIVLLVTYRHRVLWFSAISITAAVMIGFISFSDYWKAPVKRMMYKGEESEMFQARRGTWKESIKMSGKNLIFGVGFGTAEGFSEGWRGGFSSSLNVRERGSSYLSVLEGVGITGCIPFAILLVLLLRRIWLVYHRLRRVRNPADPSLPMIAIVSGGLCHALFEDWLMAVGYYLCVFFWVLVFLLVDREDRLTVFRR